MLLLTSPLLHRAQRPQSAPVAEHGMGLESDDSDSGGAVLEDAEEVLRRAASVRARRRRSEARRTARVSENVSDAAGLPSPSELAVRISRLDVNLQRFLVSQLVQLEASQATAAHAPVHSRGVTWASETRDGRGHHHINDLLGEEGGPVGQPGDAPAEGDGYASPGERDMSASDSLGSLSPHGDDAEVRGGHHQPRPSPLLCPGPVMERRSPSPRGARQARLSLAGVAGELQLPQQPDDADEQISPRVLGPSSLRLAAKRMQHGRLPGDNVLRREAGGGSRAPPPLRATAL